MMRIILVSLFIVAVGLIIFLFSRKSIVRTGYRVDQAAINDLTAKGCTRYHDGCNTCTLENGSWQCTLMWCEKMREPSCSRY